MIRIAKETDLNTIKAFVSKDVARNYFIALSLVKGLSHYKEIYIEDDKAMLFLRKSGNLQFVQYGQADIDGFKRLIKNIEFGQLIGPKSMCHMLGLKVEREGALISSLKKASYTNRDVSDIVQPLLVSDLNSVVSLYGELFTGYPKISYMTEKLTSQRGIGFTIKKGDIVSVAQSDFGTLIVGVGTHASYQHRGYAFKCMVSLMQSMFLLHDELYLQYDNSDAGRLYKKLGFKPIDQVIHYSKGAL